MRARKKKHGAERIAACSALLIEHPETLNGDPGAAFPERRPVHLEIGCGKGNFACGMAAAHPEINLIAMERVADVACLALEKARDCADTRPDNLRFLIGNAEAITEWFAPHSIACIYLNFSDPWPKKRTYKRRLTYRGFLQEYRRIMGENAEIFFKTDNRGLFEFSLNEFCADDWKLSNISLDLHNSDYEGNIMTEYEEKFSSRGMPIYRLEARNRK